MLHEMGTTTPRIFQKLVLITSLFPQNSLWAQECRGRKAPGTVQRWHKPSLQSRVDGSPRGCLPKWPGDYWYPCERGCQDWVCKRLWDHFFICGGWKWAVGSFEVPGKMWWVQNVLYSFHSYYSKVPIISPLAQFFCLWRQGLACRGAGTLLLQMAELCRVFQRAWSRHTRFFSVHSWSLTLGSNMVLSTHIECGALYLHCLTAFKIRIAAHM